MMLRRIDWVIAGVVGALLFWLLSLSSHSPSGNGEGASIGLPSATAGTAGKAERRRGRRGNFVAAAADAVDLQNVYSINFANGATERMELADSAALEPTNNTFSFFMRINIDGQNSSDIFLSKWREASDRGMVVDLESLQDGFVRPRIVLCTTGACAASISVVGPRGVIGTDVWTSIAGTVNLNNDTIRLYVDGAEVGLTASGTFPTDWVDTAADWTIGARDDGNDTRELDGQVDDVMLAPNAEWSAQCVFELHNKRGSRTIPSSCSQPATWCRGGDDDDGAGATCTDYTGNGRNWTLSTATFSNTTVPEAIEYVAASTLNRSRQTVIAFGQSNISGRGTTALAGNEFPNSDRVYIYDNNGPETGEYGTTRPATEPVDSITGQAAVFPTSVEGAQAGVGPLLAMANRLAELWPSHRIGVIPCPLGGTDTYAWATSRGQPGRLWGECQQRWQQAAIGSSAELAGIFVYQGENSSQNAFEADNWTYQWQAIIEAVRDDTGRRYMPVVFVRLPATMPGGGSFPSWAALRANQPSVCDYLDHCSIVDAPDGPYIAAGDVHLDTAAQLALGPLMANALEASEYGQLITNAGEPAQFASLGCAGSAPPCTIGNQCNNRTVTGGRTYDIIPGSATVDTTPANIVIVSCGCFSTGESCVTSDGTSIRTADGNDSIYVFIEAESIANSDCQAAANFAWTRRESEIDYYRLVVADVQENFCTTDTIWRAGLSNGAMVASFMTEATADEYPTTAALGLTYGGPVDGGVAGALHPSIATGEPANIRLMANRQDDLVNVNLSRQQCAHWRAINEGSPTPIACVQTDGGAGGDGGPADGSIATGCGPNMTQSVYDTCAAVPGTGLCCTATPDGGQVTQYCECNSGAHALFSGEWADVIEFFDTFFTWGVE